MFYLMIFINALVILELLLIFQANQKPSPVKLHIIEYLDSLGQLEWN
jgi:hypothetical protein